MIATSWRLIYEIPLGIISAVVFISLLAAIVSHRKTPSSRQKPKQYRGTHYGSGPNITHVHPRQQKQGKRIIYIPGVGYRHVQSKPKRKA